MISSARATIEIIVAKRAMASLIPGPRFLGGTSAGILTHKNQPKNFVWPKNASTYQYLPVGSSYVYKRHFVTKLAAYP
jgi:hypothetical protein